MTTMPLRLVSRSFWKNSENDRPELGLDDVREQLASEARLLRGSLIRQVEQDRVQRIEVDVIGIPTGVEVTRFVLGGDEAAVQPDSAAACGCEQLDRFGETVKETPAAFGPSESLGDLVP
ncbi:MAG: hypothetical protein ABIP99_10830 [Ilumatobacteraceae bacterium]